MYSRNNVEKGWGPNKTTKITHMNDYKNESREREREREIEWVWERDSTVLFTILSENQLLSILWH